MVAKPSRDNRLLSRLVRAMALPCVRNTALEGVVAGRARVLSVDDQGAVGPAQTGGGPHPAGSTCLSSAASNRVRFRPGIDVLPFFLPSLTTQGRASPFPASRRQARTRWCTLVISSASGPPAGGVGLTPRLTANGMFVAPQTAFSTGVEHMVNTAAVGARM